MEQVWLKTCKHFDVPVDVSDKWLERIKQQMSQNTDSRAYHNWQEMMQYKSAYMVDIPPVVNLTAFFQYFHYDCARDCNQENCETFKEFCECAQLPEQEKSIVLYLLGARQEKSMDSECNDLFALLQDLDLAILAAPTEEYNRYTSLLRREYATMDDQSFKKMRLRQTSYATPKADAQQEITNTSSKKKVKRPRKRKKVQLNKSQTKTTPKRITRQETQKRVTRQSAKLEVLKALNSSALEEGELESDDDCVLVEPPTSLVVLSDEETVPETTIVPKATAKINSNNNNSNNAVTSTPCNGVATTKNEEISLFFEDTSRIPWFDISKNLDGLTELPSADLLSTEKKQQPKRKSSPELSNVSSIDLSGVVELDKTVEEISPAKKPKLNEEPPNDNNNSNLVIELNETEEEETLKACQTILASDNTQNNDNDDSVIFVGKIEPTSDFIAFTKPSPPRINEAVSNNQLNNNQLFTRRERKELSKYNSNAYNAGPTVPESRKRFVIIDGSNVAFGHSGKREFSVRGLQICLNHIEKMGNKVKAVVPQHRFKKSRSSDWRLLEELKEQGKIIVTPCKNLPNHTSTAAYDDRFILQLAYEMDAAVISNDNYRDLIFENLGFKKIIENRVLSFAWCEDVFILAKDPYGRHGPTLDMILSC